MAYGANGPQVEALLEALRVLPAADWKRLETAASGSALREAAADALAEVLAREGLRDAWFELRATATGIARSAAAAYAAETGEGIRTIEHVASYDGWDGQHEKSRLEVLGPLHERAFIDAASDALGVVLMRPYVGESQFERFWAPFSPVLG